MEGSAYFEPLNSPRSFKQTISCPEPLPRLGWAIGTETCRQRYRRENRRGSVASVLQVLFQGRKLLGHLNAHRRGSSL